MLRFHRESYKQETEVTNESSGGQTEGGVLLFLRTRCCCHRAQGAQESQAVNDAPIGHVLDPLSPDVGRVGHGPGRPQRNVDRRVHVRFDQQLVRWYGPNGLRAPPPGFLARANQVVDRVGEAKVEHDVSSLVGILARLTIIGIIDRTMSLIRYSPASPSPGIVPPLRTKQRPLERHDLVHVMGRADRT